jgi:hypothetical protein
MSRLLPSPGGALAAPHPTASMAARKLAFKQEACEHLVTK